MVNKVLFLTVAGGFSTSFPIPADWTNVNTIEILSAGGNGANGVTGAAAGAPGSCAGYSKSLNLTGFTPGGTAVIQLGVPGSGNGSGNDTLIKDSSGTTVCLAQSGNNASGITGGAVPGVTRAVGNSLIRNGTAGATLGGSATNRGGGGGTGAPGPAGLGKIGGLNGGGQSGGGGGGADNGGAGGIGGTNGGTGGTDAGGLNAGAGATTTTNATSGTNGAGSGGGTFTSIHLDGAPGNYEPLWTSTAGPTAGPGGGGGAPGVISGGALCGVAGATTYGDGGAGGASGTTSQSNGAVGGVSIIVLTYTPAAAGLTWDPMVQDNQPQPNPIEVVAA